MAMAIPKVGDRFVVNSTCPSFSGKTGVIEGEENTADIPIDRLGKRWIVTLDGMRKNANSLCREWFDIVSVGYGRQSFKIGDKVRILNNPKRADGRPGSLVGIRVVDGLPGDVGTIIAQDSTPHDYKYLVKFKYEQWWYNCGEIALENESPMKIGKADVVLDKPKHGCTCGAFVTYGAGKGSNLHTSSGRGLAGCPWSDNA